MISLLSDRIKCENKTGYVFVWDLPSFFDMNDRWNGEYQIKERRTITNNALRMFLARCHERTKNGTNREKRIR